VTAAAGTTSLLVDGYPGHTYQFQVRARSVSGVVGSWSTASTQVSAGATRTHPWSGLYVLDGYGGIDASDSPPLGVSAYWQGWRIARAAHGRPAANAPQSGLVLDGWGGLHPYGAYITSLKGGGYWLNWDIARDFAWLPDGSGGYVLDGYGGLTGFSVNGASIPPPVQGAAYWSGRDIARKVVIFTDGKGGYVLDSFGGVHPFGIGQAAPPAPVLTDYWPNWNIARDIAVIPGTHSGYVLEGYGGVHSFAPPGQPLPSGFTNGPYWSGWDIARGIWLLPSSTLSAPAGYVLDGYGGVHQIGTAPPVARYPYWPGWDIAVSIFGA
jgi:hypothetical protein